MEKILSKNFFNAEAAKLSFFEGNGGYEILKKTFKMKPAEVTDLVKASGLRELPGRAQELARRLRALHGAV